MRVDGRYDDPVPVFLCPRCAYRESSSERNVRHQPRGCSRCGFGFAFELLDDDFLAACDPVLFSARLDDREHRNSLVFSGGLATKQLSTHREALRAGAGI